MRKKVTAPACATGAKSFTGSIGDLRYSAGLMPSVVLVAILGTAFLGEQLSAKNWLGVAMIAGGAVLVALR